MFNCSSDRKCICKICDCGRHKCPHKCETTGPWGPDICTEYGNQYQVHDACRPQSCKPPASAVRNSDPLSSITTNRADYITHDVQAPLKSEKQPYEAPEGLMDGQSVYQQEYGEKPHCASKMIKPVHAMVDNGKFESDTTSRCAFVQHDVCPPERKGQEKYVAPKEPFIAEPSYRADYVEHSAQKIQSCKPPITSIVSDAPFANTSDYRHNFVSHQMEARQQPFTQPYVKPDAPFDGITTNRQDFVELNACKPAICRPPPHRVSSDQPFCGITTNKSDYVAYDTKCIEKQERDKYVKPEGDMELRSTYTSDFINQPSSRVYPIKPANTATNNEPFDGSTSYRQNYRCWDQPAEIVHHRDKYQPPMGKFESETTSGMSYVAHNIDKQASCKPPMHHLQQQPFDGQTSYRTEYVQRDINPCPAESLSKNPRSLSPSGYLYDGEDHDGHVHYVRCFPKDNMVNEVAPVAT